MGFQIEPEIKDEDLERENVVSVPHLITSLLLGPTVTRFPRERVWGGP